MTPEPTQLARFQARLEPVAPTGPERFAAMTPEEQDAAIGPAAAEAVRSGKAKLSDFIERSGDGPGPRFIRQRPVQDLQ